MEKEELKEIIRNHQHFLEQDVDNWESMRANLKERDLSSAIITWQNLRQANLRKSNLRNADLRWSDLRYADLREVDLREANLAGADLRWACLTNANLANTNLSLANLVGARLEGANLNLANLRDANLQYAHFEGANLNAANLQYACLQRANLNNAKLNRADLKGANLQIANLFNAKLTNANLDSAILTNAILSKKDEIRKGIILSKSIIGWKKCEGDVIVKLKIPKGAVVFSINGKKCRTNKCKVISIEMGNTAISIYNHNFTYTVGKVIEIDNFDLSYNVECGTGIHFFLSEEDARKY